MSDRTVTSKRRSWMRCVPHSWKSARASRAVPSSPYSVRSGTTGSTSAWMPASEAASWKSKTTA
eukprot:514897-Alexandrium_andersonii.AAC.1